MEATATNQTRPIARRVVSRTSKLGLGRLVSRPSSVVLTSDVEVKPKETAKENARAAQPPPSAFTRDKNIAAPELKRKGSTRLQLKGSASRLGGLGNLVRRASRNLRDVTNISPTGIPDSTQFVDVGVEDVPAVNGDISVEVHTQGSSHAHIKAKTELEIAALEGNDPDIGEIMVVTRHKSRTELNREWAPEQQDEASATDAEGRIGKSKTGWWSSKGKKADGQ